MHSTGVIFLYILKYCLSREHCDVEILYKFIHKRINGRRTGRGGRGKTLKVNKQEVAPSKGLSNLFPSRGEKKLPILAFADPVPNIMLVIQARVPLQGVGEILQSISG